MRDAPLVSLEAELLQRIPHAANPKLILQQGPIIFTAQLGAGRFPDEPEFRPLFRRAEELDIPILLHPAYPMTYDATKGYEMAAGLGVPFRFTERKGDEMGLRRGFSLRQGERVVIVEDVVTTGRSTLETAALATSRGARVVAAGARQGEHRIFLQVEEANLAARALYARCGFAGVHRYHYRVAPG